MQQLRQSHAQQMLDLRQYLENSLSRSYRPSPDLLNLRKIESHLSKQKK